jgi:hypothetical protein
MDYLFLHTLSSLGSSFYEPKLALLGKITVLLQSLLLLGSSVLLGAHDVTPLVHQQLGLAQTTRSLVSSTIVHLGARPNQNSVCLAINVVKSVCLSKRFLHSIQ